jgi:hypothetical protein
MGLKNKSIKKQHKNDPGQFAKLMTRVIKLR